MFLKSLNIPGSGLTAEQYRLNIISQNITNAETTRTASGGPYRRKVPIYQEVTHERESFGIGRGKLIGGVNFSGYLSKLAAAKSGSVNGGVRIPKVVEDPSPGKMVYDPEHPDADENGYVEYPNVEMVQEMVNMMGASRSYEANVQSLNAMKAMAMRALEIGK